MLKASKHEAHLKTRHRRARVKDSFDRARVYARSFGDVFSLIATNRSFTGSIVRQVAYYTSHLLDSQRWFDGHSGGETPGLIPNPAVKPACVILGTMVREPMGRLPFSGLGLLD
jgi:hypothetical protein